MASERFLAQLAAHGAPQWTTAVDWSNDGGHSWQPCTFVDGQAVNDQTSQVRWTSNVTVTDAPYGRDGLNPYITRFRIRRGIRFSDHEQPEYIGLGVYRVKAARRSTTDDLIQLQGESFESYLIRARIYRPRTIKSASAIDIVTKLITEILPKAAVDWDPSIDQSLQIPQLVSVTERWATIDGDSDARSIAQALGARIFTSGDGVWLIRPVPSLQDEPAFEFTEGEDGVSLGTAEELSSDGVANVEVVVGTAGSVMIGPGIAKDTDPASLTYVGRNPDQGGFGEIAGAEYQSQMVATIAQAENVARARLANRLGLRRTLDLGVLHNPTLRAGQVGIVHGFGEANKIILDSVTFDLSSTPGPMLCQTRTQQTRLAGSISDLVEDTGEDGDLT